MRPIDADALIKRWDEMSVRGRTEFDQEIMVAPSIDIDRPQGEWIWDEQILGLVCSECKELGVERSNFCPHCGARMKGADDE